jgi:hypothetical protein
MNNTERKSNLFKHPYVKNILSALVVACVGFVLLNLTFLLAYLVNQFITLFSPDNPETFHQWLTMIGDIIFLIIIALISWVILRSKLSVLIKATFLTVPTAVALVTIGILLSSLSVLPYLIGALSTISVMFYFYRTHQSWLYYYSVILVALTLLVFTLMGGEM